MSNHDETSGYQTREEPCGEEMHGRITLTVGEVRRRQAVAQKHTVGLRHLQVDHIRCVLQGCDGLLVAHLLQSSGIHLHTHTQALTIWLCSVEPVGKSERSLTASSLSPIWSLPSLCAAPPSIILVTQMLLSPGMCWFPTPPAMLKPRPAEGQTERIEVGGVRSQGKHSFHTPTHKKPVESQPLGPFTSLSSSTFSHTGFLRRMQSRTSEPASFRASTARLWVTSRTSTSLTLRMTSLTLEQRKMSLMHLRQCQTISRMFWRGCPELFQIN